MRQAIANQHARTHRPRLVATLGLLALGLAATSNASANTACDTRACFDQAVQSCQAASYSVRKPLGQVRYQVLEPVDGQRCRLSLTYLDNPNPAWEGKALQFVVDRDQAVGPQLKQAVKSCLTDSGDDYQCAGPLLAVVVGHSSTPTHQTNDASPCGVQVSIDGEPLFAMRKSGLWGYVNRAGEWIIEPQWPQVRPFSEGRAVVRVDDTWFRVIDRNGAYISEARFHAAGSIGGRPVSPVGDFSQGCAAVESFGAAQQPWYLTRSGETWLKEEPPSGLPEGAQVTRFGNFHEGKAWFAARIDKGWKYGWINADGEVVIAPTFADAGNFSEGLAPAAADRNNRGYIDAEGRFVYPPKQTLVRAMPFSEGLAAVTMDSSGPWYYSDGKNVVIREMTFPEPRTLEISGKPRAVTRIKIGDAGAFHAGLAAVRPESMHLALFYIDKAGTVALDPAKQLDMTLCTWNRLPEFRHGLALLRVKDPDAASCSDGSHYLYIDTEGNIVLDERKLERAAAP